MLHFSDNVAAVEIDKIDREPHAECVYRLAGYNPQALAFIQGLPAEQTSPANRSPIGDFHPGCHHAPRAQVLHLEHARCVMALSSAIRF